MHTEMIGKKRHIADKIKYLMRYFPAVTLLGARQVGKTTLSKQVASNWRYLDLENPSDFDRIGIDPTLFFEQYPEKLILDEAQNMPVIFNILRGVIDKKRNTPGRFLITGSSQPALLNQVSESLAGRVAIVELGTLKISEYYQKALSPFYKIFSKKLSKTELNFTGSAPLKPQQIHHIWLKGGYPEPTLKKDNHFYQLWMQNYFDTYINRDILKLFPKLNVIAYRKFIYMICNLSSTILNKADLARSLEISQTSIKDYLEIAEGTFLWRMLPSFEKNITKSIIKMPKGYLRDSGLLHFLLKISDIEELHHHPIVGHSFEGFVIEEILKGLEATLLTNWQAYYYRTRAGAEIDLILDGPFGTLPIEIKYGQTIQRKQLNSLTDFVKTHKLPFGLLINQAKEACWLTPEIYQLPVGWL